MNLKAKQISFDESDDVHARDNELTGGGGVTALLAS